MQRGFTPISVQTALYKALPGALLHNYIRWGWELDSSLRLQHALPCPVCIVMRMSPPAAMQRPPPNYCSCCAVPFHQKPVALLTALLLRAHFWPPCCDLPYVVHAIYM
eukprot:362932-Chlamydomonas_euryale.AAC.3